MKHPDIPAPTIKRLSLYLRYLEECHTRGDRTISSKRLGGSLNLTDAQVRKDLAYFGPFGHPGIGYRVDDLRERIRRILGTDKTWQVVLVGAGNLGSSLAAYRGFAEKGFKLVAIFDVQEGIVGRPMAGAPELKVCDIAELSTQAQQLGAKLGILAVPPDQAQHVVNLMIAAGIKGILNFAPVSLTVPEDVSVVGVDLAVHLEQLSFRVASGAEADDPEDP